MLNFKSLFTKLMEEYGFEKVEREPQDYIFFKLGSKLVIFNIVFDREVSGDDVMFFSRTLEQISGEKYILCLKDFTKDAEKVAARTGIILQNRESLAKDVGELMFKRIEEVREEVDIEALFQEESFKIEDVAVSDRDEGQEQEDTIPIFLEEAEVSREQIVKPLISKEESIRRVMKVIHGFDASLILIPYILFEYSLEVIYENDFTPKHKSGVVGVNVSASVEIGVIRFFEKGLELVSSLSESHQRVAVSMSLDVSKLKAREEIENRFEGEEERSTAHENVIIIEKRRFKPQKDSIKLKEIGIHYWPCWIVRGSRGSTMVDAVEGAIIAESSE